MVDERGGALRRNILIYLSVMGPGLIAAMAGNDAGGITTYSAAGANYGFRMLWLLVLTTVSLIVFQVMCARMGAVTGKGLAALIREKFGLRPTFFAMMVLLVANIAVTASEFAGIAASMELFNLSKYVVVPLFAIMLWLLIAKASFKAAEKAFLVLCLIQLSYIISGILAKPDWLEVTKSMVTPSITWSSSFLMMAIAVVGTTITPWMQFFIQANVVDKNIRMDRYRYERVDVVSGVLVTNIVALFIIICTAATLFPIGQKVGTAKEAALALGPLAGNYATLLFGIGLFGASMLAANIVPLSTAYALCEAFGWESGIGKKFGEAPRFAAVYTLTLVIGALVVLVPKISLVSVMLLSQELNGILLPVILIYMLLIVNDHKIMGDRVNGPVFNVIAWATAIGVIFLTLAMIVTSL